LSLLLISVFVAACCLLLVACSWFLVAGCLLLVMHVASEL